MNHSPEPWSLAWACSGDDGSTITKPLESVTDDDDGVLTAVDASGRMLESDPYDGVGENWRRIVACVNACRGIPTEVLTQVGLDGVCIGVVRKVQGGYQTVFTLDSSPPAADTSGGDCGSVASG